MQTRTFYRLENSQGNGIFHSAASGWEDIYEAHGGELSFLCYSPGSAAPALDGMNVGNEETHPCPDNDPGLADWWRGGRGKYLFGFESLAQLRSWFGPKALAFLAEIDAQLCTVTSDDYVIGTRQVCFHQRATITRAPLTAMLEELHASRHGGSDA